MTFFNFLEKEMYFYLNREFYHLEEKEGQNLFRWHTQEYSITKTRLSDLEKLMDFAVNKVIERPNGNYFFYKDCLFKIVESRDGIIRVDNSVYKIGPFNGKTRSIKDSFYSKEMNLGFEKNDYGFFIYTVVEPYVLYEKRNGKYYKFDEAKIGVEIIGETWREPIVINSYSHPALRSKNIAFQKICNGSYDYNAIRRKYKQEDQVKVVLEKAKSMMLRGYFSQKGSWHSLTELMFKEHEVYNPDKRTVSNL